MKKRFCILQVTPDKPNKQHQEMFSNVESDFYFVTHDKFNKDALEYCPNTVWSETRNTLVNLVPKQYDYYGFYNPWNNWGPNGYYRPGLSIGFRPNYWNNYYGYNNFYGYGNPYAYGGGWNNPYYGGGWNNSFYGGGWNNPYCWNGVGTGWGYETEGFLKPDQ